MKRKRKLEVSGGGYLTGFYYACAHLLKRTAQGKRPDPRSVWYVISDRRPSRRMILDIFRHAPQLLQHQSTSVFVKQMYNEFFMTGNLNPKYGKGGATAFDCRRRKTSAA